MNGDSGTLEGYAATFGNVDRGADVIVKGAFAATLAAFRKSGLVTWMHDLGRPIGYPLEVREDDHGLWLKAAFHSTADAQAVRSIVAERLAAGLTFGLSIGYRPTPQGARQVGAVRELTDLTLFEIGVVGLPMNEQALVTAAKGLSLGTPVAFAIGQAGTKSVRAGARKASRGELLELMGHAQRLGVRLPPGSLQAVGRRRD